MEIVIYDCHWPQDQPQAQTIALPVKSDLGLTVGKLAKNIGYFLIILALTTGLYAASPFIIKEARYRLQPKLQEVSVKASFRQKLITTEAEGYGVTTDFSLVIPKINAKAKIIPNVDPGNKEEYTDALKQGVAHAYGTSFPGSKGNVFIFSHSTNAPYNIERFNAVFYLLKELEPKDKIIIFYAGQKFEYQVTDKQTIEADDTSWLTSNSNEERLILQTCWPPGTSLKRLIVIAKPIS